MNHPRLIWCWSCGASYEVEEPQWECACCARPVWECEACGVTSCIEESPGEGIERYCLEPPPMNPIFIHRGVRPVARR